MSTGVGVHAHAGTGGRERLDTLRQEGGDDTRQHVAGSGGGEPGLPPVLTPRCRRLRSATSVSSPFSTTTAPGAQGRLSRAVEPRRTDVARASAEQPRELARVRRQNVSDDCGRRRARAPWQRARTARRRPRAVAFRRLLHHRESAPSATSSRGRGRDPTTTASARSAASRAALAASLRQVPAVVRQRHGHHLGELDLEDLIQRGRHRGPHPSGAGAHRALAGHAHCARQPGGATDDQHAAGAELGRGSGAAWHRVDHAAADQAARRRSRPPAARDADVRRRSPRPRGPCPARPIGRASSAGR